MLPWMALTAAALAGLLAAESRGSRWGIYACKPLASMGFVGLALAAGALGSGYGDRFVRESFANKLWGLPLYYAAQLCLAASVAR